MNILILQGSSMANGNRGKDVSLKKIVTALLATMLCFGIAQAETEPCYIPNRFLQSGLRQSDAIMSFCARSASTVPSDDEQGCCRKTEGDDGMVAGCRGDVMWIHTARRLNLSSNRGLCK